MNSSDMEESSPAAVYRVFVDQTAATIYARPSAEADVVARLEQGLPLDLLPITPDSGKHWLPARTDSGLAGFLSIGAKTITADVLHGEREKIQRGYALGRNKMFIGAGNFSVRRFCLSCASAHAV